mmetsp:Transcript_97888/g.176687  ORF Transcript_97888/g.176687 Transcript_97888/m.176687 type:complete len:217 (-) Transcript_97888:9-659(-)
MISITRSQGAGGVSGRLLLLNGLLSKDDGPLKAAARERLTPISLAICSCFLRRASTTRSSSLGPRVSSSIRSSAMSFTSWRRKSAISSSIRSACGFSCPSIRCSREIACNWVGGRLAADLEHVARWLRTSPEACAAPNAATVAIMPATADVPSQKNDDLGSPSRLAILKRWLSTAWGLSAQPGTTAPATAMTKAGITPVRCNAHTQTICSVGREIM